MLLFIECKPDVLWGHSKRFSVRLNAILMVISWPRHNFHKQANCVAIGYFVHLLF